MRSGRNSRALLSPQVPEVARAIGASVTTMHACRTSATAGCKMAATNQRRYYPASDGRIGSFSRPISPSESSAPHVSRYHRIAPPIVRLADVTIDLRRLSRRLINPYHVIVCYRYRICLLYVRIYHIVMFPLQL